MAEQNNLRPAWDAILEVYKPFAEICQRHNLRMWAAYGTAIGAVRHKGFIPWDDDFDVVMPRCDYERFLRDYAHELPEHLKIITSENTPEYTLNFAKVQETRRSVVEDVEKKLGRSMPQGIYVDIFPLDGYRAGESILGKRFWMLVYKFRRAWLYREYYPKQRKNLILFTLGFLCGIFTPRVHSRRAYMKAYDKLSSQFSFDESPECTYYDPLCRYCKHYPVSAFEETILLPFESLLVPFPKGVNTCLLIEYGSDYMTPPPPEKRISNHQDSLEAQWKFGPTKIG